MGKKKGSGSSGSSSSSSMEYSSHEGGGSSPPFVSAPSSPVLAARGGELPSCYYSAPASPSGGCGIRRHQSESEDRTQQQLQGGRRSVSSSASSSFNSEFEFSARFSVFDETPMSPTPMYSSSSSGYSGKKDSINFFFDYRPSNNKPQLTLTPPPSFSSRLSGSLPSHQPISAPQSPCSWRNVHPPLIPRGSDAEHAFATFPDSGPRQQMKEAGNGGGSTRHRHTRSLSPLHFFRHKPAPKPPPNPPSNPPASTPASKLKGLLRRLRSKDVAEPAPPNPPPRLFARSGSSSKSSSCSSSQSDPTATASSTLLSSSSSSSSTSSSISRSSSSANERAPVQIKSKHHMHMHMHTKKGGNNSSNTNNNGISPHELHYTFQRAQTKELRKKTFLPYHQSLFAGCLSFTSRSYGATVSTISRTIRPVS